MTSATLINEVKKKYRTKFTVEIDVRDMDNGLESMDLLIEDLKKMNWELTKDLAKIIQNN